MIVIHVNKNSEDAASIKKYLKSKGLTKQVKLRLVEDDINIILSTYSGTYKGMNKVTSYLRGFFYECKAG